jgi:dephospho-CoA kinase
MLIGLTGQTGAGKSQVSAILREHGFGVIDADRAAREVTYAGGECLREIAAEFGEDILLPDGSLDRKALGEIVFSDAEKKKKLEAIIFPHIMREVGARYIASDTEVVFLDAPTLFESGADKSCAKVVSVIAPADVRMKRIVERDNLTQKEAESRMRSQHEDEWYVSRSDYVIRNDKSDIELYAGVREMLRVLLQGRPPNL